MAYLVHYGIKRKSGRYPWGSGKDAYQHDTSFRAQYSKLKASGMSQKEIAKALGIVDKRGEGIIQKLRDRITIENDIERNERIIQAEKLRNKGYSPKAIAEIMKTSEGTVRNLLDPINQEKARVLKATTDMLREQLKTKPYLDIGTGVEFEIGINEPKLKAAITALEAEGYKTQLVKIPQQGTNKETLMKVLTKDDVPYTELIANKDKIRTITDWSEDGGSSWNSLEPVKSIDSKRILVKFKEDGGTEKDGMIELRRGVEDLQMDKKYAQVRIEVDGKYYMKGMAVYSDNMPDGVDIIYNSNKSKEKGPYAAFKENDGDDPTNPFGSSIRQVKYLDKNGEEQLSPLNRVGYSSKMAAGEEGYWDTWATGDKTPSQFLSKQKVDVAKNQLDLAIAKRREEFNEIQQLQNPTIKKMLLEKFADESDSRAVEMAGAPFPGQSSKVILGMPTLRPNEVYATSYNDGDRLALVRFPQSGPSEIPVLVVNNKNKEGIKMLGKDSRDAIGIHPRAAEQLSGADFDGDSVIVIPNNNGRIHSSEPLPGLKGFDNKSYRNEALPKMSDTSKGTEMGKAANLITDMSLKGASPEKLAQAIKYSMVVIDAQKWSLDYKQAARDFQISDLKREFQGGPTAGAGTIVSRSTARMRSLADVRALKKGDPGYEDVVRGTGYSIDKVTGRKVVTEVEPKTWVDRTTGEIKSYQAKRNSTRMYETEDARTLLSKNPSPMELIYANYANREKALGNQARKESISLKPIPYNPSAKATYEREAKELVAMSNISKRNAPFERQAQLLTAARVKAAIEANPGMKDSEIRKLRGQALVLSREKVGAGKPKINITEKQAQAIQAGAISNAVLTRLLKNADTGQVKKLFMPKESYTIPDAKASKARAMYAKGKYTMAEIAAALNVSPSSVASMVQ